MSTTTTDPNLQPASATAGAAALPNLGTIVVGNATRYYGYYDPDPNVTDPVPLVVCLHGGGGNMAIMANALGFNNLAAPKPYVAVFPQGYNPLAQTGAPPDGSWNSGQAYVPYQDPNGPQDDVAFIDALLIEMAAVAAARGIRIDQSRTYAVGFSNGGMMTHRLAAERSEEFAAIAVMQASIGGDPDPADPSLPFHVNNPADHGAEPVALLQLHGLLDPKVKLTEGYLSTGPTPRSDLPVTDAVDAWVANNNCDPHPTLESNPMGLLRTWGGGDNDVEVKLLTMPGIGHQVPSGAMQVIESFLFSHSK